MCSSARPLNELVWSGLHTLRRWTVPAQGTCITLALNPVHRPGLNDLAPGSPLNAAEQRAAACLAMLVDGQTDLGPVTVPYDYPPLYPESRSCRSMMLDLLVSPHSTPGKAGQGLGDGPSAASWRAPAHSSPRRAAPWQTRTGPSARATWPPQACSSRTSSARCPRCADLARAAKGTVT